MYTDFYKWSLNQDAGKLALQLSVFADSSFSRRNDYTFRTKEAVRMSTCIEFFIEKFMSVCHIGEELVEGAFDEVSFLICCYSIVVGVDLDRKVLEFIRWFRGPVLRCPSDIPYLSCNILVAV